VLRSSFDQVRSANRATSAVEIAREGSGSDGPQPVVPKSAAARALAGNLRVFALSRTHYDILSLLNVADEFGFSVTVLGGHEAYKVADRLAKSPPAS
jgi:hypothetical protein